MHMFEPGLEMEVHLQMFIECILAIFLCSILAAIVLAAA